MAGCRDISGRRNHGRYGGHPKPTPGAIAGDLDPGRAFDGVDDYVVADRVIRDLPALGFSFGCWFRPAATEAVGEGVLAINTAPGTEGFYGGASNRGMILWGGGGEPSRVQWVFGTSAGGADIVGPTITPNADWHLVIATFGTTTELWVDGVSAGTISMDPQNALLPTDRFSFAQEWDHAAASDFFGGDLDDVFALNREITSGEAANLYDLGTGATPGDYRDEVLDLAGLVGYWRLNDRGGWVVGRVGR